MTPEILHSLKIAFTYMPQAIEVNKYDYGENYEAVLAHINIVRETLLAHDVDPDEVAGEINPKSTPNSYY